MLNPAAAAHWLPMLGFPLWVIVMVLFLAWLRTKIAQLLSDPCPVDTCDGWMEYVREQPYEGESGALWACRRCHCEVLRRARGFDVILCQPDQHA